MHSVAGHADKVFGVAWAEAGTLLSGGADSVMRVHALG